MKEIVEIVRSGDAARLAQALENAPELAAGARVAVDAARAGNLPVLKVLDRFGANWNSLWRGYRPLHALIQEKPHGAGAKTSSPGRLKSLRFLLEHGADPEALGAFPPACAAVIAAFSGEPAMLATLLESGANVDGFVACALGDWSGVRRALKADASLPASRAPGGLTALQCCAGSRLGMSDAGVARNLLKIARALLEAGADANARTKAWDHEVDVQYFAISAGNVDLVRLLFEAGADATAAFPTAMWREDMNFAELAIARGARINELHDGRPVLNELIRWGQIRPALWLLDRGADPNVPDRRGWTAVHQAASRGNARIYRALLDHGGDPSRRDASGMSAIDIARDTGNAAKFGIGRAVP